MVIDVIDNGGQWTHREWRMLRYLGVDTQILPNDVPVSEMRELDGLILSGGAARVGLTGKLGNCAEYLSLEVPILGYALATNSWLDTMEGLQGGSQARVRCSNHFPSRGRWSPIPRHTISPNGLGEP